MDQDYLVGIVGVIGAWDEHNGAQQYEGPESGEFLLEAWKKDTTRHGQDLCGGPVVMLDRVKVASDDKTTYDQKNRAS